MLKFLSLFIETQNKENYQNTKVLRVPLSDIATVVTHTGRIVRQRGTVRV
jgi:hypothetical protein